MKPVRAPLGRRADRPGSKITAVVLGLLVLVSGYFALGMPGMQHGASSDEAGMSHKSGRSGWTRRSVAQFAETMADVRTVTINVHAPDEGDLPGTDLTIPFDSILDNPSLPRDRATQVAVYCRTGSMSTIAAQALADAGYVHVVELEGGMDAWERAGRSVR